MKPRLLDLFCCAGGGGMGYYRAGFEVIGVDIDLQPRYPFEVHQGDALEFLRACGHDFDVVHASPPCHDHTYLKSLSGLDGTGWLLPATRQALTKLGKPWVIENTPGAAMRTDAILCGEMFGLHTVRHRWFESNMAISGSPPHSKHVRKTATSRRRERFAQGWNVSITGDVGTWVGVPCMGIDWMNGDELSQAIPPAYTEHIGRQLMDQLCGTAAA